MRNLLYVLLCALPPLLSSAQGTSFDEFFQALIEEEEIPGLSVAVVEDGGITYSGALGVKSFDTRELVNESTIFAAASLSKPVFAYAVLQLVEEGKLDLDKPLYKYLEYPDIAHDERYKQITARMVLSHSSGFPNWRNGQLNILFTPSERFRYSGEGFVYLMRVVEHITQMPLNDFMEERVFDPLGMAHTSYVWKEAFEENFAVPHDDLGFPVSKYRPEEGNAAHSLQTTAADYAKFLLAMLQPQGLKASTVELMLSPVVEVAPSSSGPAPKSPEISWGLGWGLQGTSKEKAFWHWGDNNTFRCFVIAYPDKGKGVVYFTNSNLGLRITPKIVERVLGERCPAWEWLGYEREDAPWQLLFKAILEKGYGRAIPPFLEKNGRQLDTARINEWQMNQIGYRLMERHRYEDAQKVFYANMQAFPKSANTYDSYAEAHLRTGDFETARKYYSKALELDPQNAVAESIVRQLAPKSPKGNTSFRLNAYPHARLVTLAGEFNGWNPVSLPFIRQNGEWVCTLGLEPGRYEYKLIIDGVWTPDPENPEVTVNEGNLNSVMVVVE